MKTSVLIALADTPEALSVAFGMARLDVLYQGVSTARAEV